MVTIAASWAHFVSYFLKLNRQLTKVLVTSGATAGLAAAFNTPIAAVVFTIEEILGELNTKYLGPIIVTSVFASITSYKLLGGKTTFVPLRYGFSEEWHLGLYFLLGITMSLVGYLFTKSILISKDLRKNYFKKLDFIFIVVAVILAAIASHFSPAVLGDGAAMINSLLSGNTTYSLTFLSLLFVIKLLLSSTSYSSGLSGGLFMPVLFLGALVGCIFAILATRVGVSDVEVGAFVLLGMTSMLVAVIRTPFTAFILLFEMTRDYDLIVPLMISSITAYWISNLINPESVYESVAEYEGVHLPTSSDNECLNEMSVEECMIKDISTLDFDSPVSAYEEFILENDFGGYPVLKNKQLIGIANKRDLKKAILEDENILIKDVVKHSTISIHPDQSLLVAMDRMKRFEIGRLPVVSRFNDKHLLGIVTPEDIVNYIGLSKEDQIDESPV